MDPEALLVYAGLAATIAEEDTDIESLKDIINKKVDEIDGMDSYIKNHPTDCDFQKRAIPVYRQFVTEWKTRLEVIKSLK